MGEVINITQRIAEKSPSSKRYELPEDSSEALRAALIATHALQSALSSTSPAKILVDGSGHQIADDLRTYLKQLDHAVGNYANMLDQ